LKYKSFAAYILGERVLRRTTFWLLPNELEDVEPTDDNLFKEDTSLLSVTPMLGAAKEPTEDMVMKVDAIYSLNRKSAGG
jgi:hypothetical protein